MKHNRSLASFVPVLVGLVLLAGSLRATDYYVSPTGNDENTGTATTAAWRTLAKVAASTASFHAGDRLLFERGGSYFGSVFFPSSNNFTVGAYGSGALPVIHGLESLTDWELVSGNVWRAPCTAPSVNFVVVDGVNRPLGRHPNNAYLSMDTVNGHTSFTDAEMAPADTWTGGQCVVKPVRWILDVALIEEQTATQITLAPNSGNNFKAGWGYFIQNHPNTLDLEGEWALFEDFVYLCSASDPNGHTVQIATQDTGFQFNNATGLVVENLRFTYFNTHGVRVYTTGTNVTVRDCEFQHLFNGITCSHTTGALLTRNTLRDCLNNAINSFNIGNLKISSNDLDRSAMVPGRGASGDGAYHGIFANTNRATSLLITHNKLHDNGYNGIAFRNTGPTEVSYNHVDGACLVKDDGAAIYSSSDNYDTYRGYVIKRNVVGRTPANTEGLIVAAGLSAHGIYLDDKNYGATVEDNVIYDSSQAAYIHNSHDIVFRRNLIVDSLGSFLMSKDSTAPANPRIVGCTMVDNTFVNANTSMDKDHYSVATIFRGAATDDPALLNVFDFNRYITPFSTADIFRQNDHLGLTATYSLAEWQAAKNNDLHSATGPIWNPASGIPREEFMFFDYATETAKTVVLPRTYVDVNGSIVSGSVILQPYTGIVLFAKDVAAMIGFPEWAAAAGLTGAQALATADPDADGMSNLLEYALHTDPLAPSVEQAPVLCLDSASLALTHRRSKSANVAWTYQVSSDLLTWADAVPTVSVVSADADDDGTTELVRAFLPLAAGDARRFLRLAVTQP